MASTREGRLRIDSEYRRYWRNQEIFGGTSESFADVRGWYVSGAYRICKRLQIGSYYSRYTITNIIERRSCAAFYPPTTDTSLPANHDYDKVITGRVDLNKILEREDRRSFHEWLWQQPVPERILPASEPAGLQARHQCFSHQDRQLISDDQR